MGAETRYDMYGRVFWSVGATEVCWAYDLRSLVSCAFFTLRMQEMTREFKERARAAGRVERH